MNRLKELSFRGLIMFVSLVAAIASLCLCFSALANSDPFAGSLFFVLSALCIRFFVNTAMES